MFGKSRQIFPDCVALLARAAASHSRRCSLPQAASKIGKVPVDVSESIQLVERGVSRQDGQKTVNADFRLVLVLVVVLGFCSRRALRRGRC
jgi:hypothetical protein